MSTQDNQQVIHRGGGWLPLGRAYLLGEMLNGGAEGGVGLAEALDCPVGVENGAMVSAAEVAADFFQAVPGEASRQVHADLAGEADGFATFSALHGGSIWS